MYTFFVCLCFCFTSSFDTYDEFVRYRSLTIYALNYTEMNTNSDVKMELLNPTDGKFDLDSV